MSVHSTLTCAGRSSQKRGSRAGFTLIEILMAAMAGALILGSIYTVFTRAVHLRNTATERTRLAQLRARAASVIRTDLQNAWISGRSLAAILEGSRNNSSGSSFPGYLRFTTTTARASDVESFGDVQEVQYYISKDGDSSERDAGVLVRAVSHNLLGSTQEVDREELLLPGVSSLEISFSDGQSWVESWEVTEADATLPKAVRVLIQPHVSSTKKEPAVPIEVIVPWTVQPTITPTSDATGTSSSGTAGTGSPGGAGTGSPGTSTP